MDHILFKEQVLQRYKPLTDSNTGIMQQERGEKMNQDFINLLVRAFEEENNFSYREFRNFPITTVIDYIRRTHRLYLNKTLQEIEQSLGILNQAYETGHPLLTLLNDFYLTYKTDLIRHIREEDDRLLPYIEYLIGCLNTGFDQYEFYRSGELFSIKQFLENHEDNDSVLDDVRIKILQYKPPVVNRFIYRVLLNQLEFFSHDLKIHGLIEDHVLLPIAKEMEVKMTEEFLGIVGRN